ncbi:MAG: hypothetical protein RI564_09700 [Gracilimonas sp.]|nr:hypothetical protein [Gracilimonas sp.]
MMRSTPLLSLLLLLFLPAIGTAQTTQSGGDGSLLPEINPQDIEIRSEFRARFPGLRRQSILGFNPEPRVFQFDVNRMPFIETREQAVADISLTELDRPEPPQRTLLTIPAQRNAYLRGAFGSYLSPEVEAFAHYELNEKSLLSSNVNFSGSDGHLENQESGFRFLDASAKYINQRSEDLKLILDIGALSDQNYVFDLVDNIQQNFIGETAHKDYLGFNGQVALQNKKNNFTGWNLAAGGSFFSSNFYDGTSGLGRGDISENKLFASYSNYWTGNRMYETFEATANIDAGSYDPSQANDENWVLANASFQYKRLFNFTTSISGKAGFAYASDAFSNNFYFTPEIEIVHNFNNKLSLTGIAYGKPEMQTVQDHQQYNRFLQNRFQLQHSYKMKAKVSVDYKLFEGNRIFAGTSYSHIKNNAVYQRFISTAPTTFSAFYDINYANANIFKFYTGASYQLMPGTFWTSGRIYFRAPNLSSGQTIPYEEKIGVKGSISYKPIKALTINGWTEYIGKRQSPETGTELDAYLLLNTGAEYQINDTFGVYAKLLNILGQNYQVWNGYQERPFQIFGGITIKL